MPVACTPYQNSALEFGGEVSVPEVGIRVRDFQVGQYWYITVLARFISFRKCGGDLAWDSGGGNS